MGLARQEAQRFNHYYIGTEHVLLGLVQEGSGVAASVLKHLDIDLKKIRQEVEKLVSTGTTMVTMGQLPFTPCAKKALEFALKVARDLGQAPVGTEHLLLGLLRVTRGHRRAGAARCQGAREGRTSTRSSALGPERHVPRAADARARGRDVVRARRPAARRYGRGRRCPQARDRDPPRQEHDARPRRVLRRT